MYSVKEKVMSIESLGIFNGQVNSEVLEGKGKNSSSVASGSSSGQQVEIKKEGMDSVLIERVMGGDAVIKSSEGALNLLESIKEQFSVDFSQAMQSQASSIPRELPSLL